MPDREKVISNIEYYCKYPDTAPLHYYGGKIVKIPEQLMRNALVLLKAQGPRVMAYDELASFDGAFLIESSAISQLDWVFFFDVDSKSDAIWVEGFDGEHYVVYREDYGTYTRCWTSRPTDEQREATPWN